MKIDPVSQQIMIKKYTANVRVQDASAKSALKDKVELSDSAVTFSAAMKAAGAIAGGRDTEQLREIKEIAMQVRAGTFNIPGREIANKMI